MSLIQSVPLDFCYATTGAVYEPASIIHAVSWVNLTAADCTGFVARVIFVMIVILKVFPEMGHISKPKTEFGISNYHFIINSDQLPHWALHDTYVMYFCVPRT